MEGQLTYHLIAHKGKYAIQQCIEIEVTDGIYNDWQTIDEDTSRARIEDVWHGLKEHEEYSKIKVLATI